MLRQGAEFAPYGGTRMQTQTPQRQDFTSVVAAIRREYEVLNRWLSAISPAHWQGPTNCTEWDVTKTVSHLGSGAEIHQLTIAENVDGGAPVTNEVRQGIWGHFDSLTPEPLYADFRDRNESYLRYLEGLPAAKREQNVKFFMGDRPVAGYAQYRLFELSLHSWDLRVGLDPTARLLPGSASALWSIGRENVNRRANAQAKTDQEGAVYGVEVYGPVNERFALAVREGAVQWLDSPPSAVAASVRLAAEACIRLYTGRLPLEQAEADGEVTITGDRAAALRLNALFPGF
jgi:uncharacterized protein (TIGR03083 family)